MDKTRQQKRAEDKERKKALIRANNQIRLQIDHTYRTLDERIEKEKVECGIEDEISCRRGCAHCCKQLITLSRAEARYIALKHPEKVEKAVPVLEQHVKLLNDIGGIAFNYDDFYARDQASQAWFREQVPCPFLDEKNDCTIYDARPMACRVYYVALVDPAECAIVPPPGEEHQIPGWDPPSAMEMGFRVMHTAQNVLHDDRVGPFAAYLLKAWDQIKSVKP